MNGTRSNARGTHPSVEDLLDELERGNARMDGMGYSPITGCFYGPRPSRRLEPAPAIGNDDSGSGETAAGPQPRHNRPGRGLRVALSITALVLCVACTPEQLATLARETGHPLEPATATALLDLPDTPMPLGDGRMIATDGTITAPIRPGHCDQWRQVALAAGWTATEYDTWASRVVYRESHCNPTARSRSHDSGLFQINDVVLADMRQRPGLWHEAIDKLGTVPTITGLFDPYTNAVVAENLYDIRGRAPWT